METTLAVQTQIIEDKIYEIRGQKVMLDFDLAQMYEVETRVLKQAVKRNIDRFPQDFMFILTEKEVNEMVSQFVIPSKSYFGGAFPFAFTEQGVAMLSSVLKSKRALQMNVSIMRAFVFIRQYALSHRELTEKLRQLEEKYDEKFNTVNEAINFLLKKKEEEFDQKNRKMIGF